MTTHTKPPTRRAKENPFHFIQRVCGWLSEPDRRRLGNQMREEVMDAALELSKGTVYVVKTITVLGATEDTEMYLMSDGSVRWK